MAISYDNSGKANNNSTSLSLSYATTASSNRLMIIGATINNGDTATGVTYNSVAGTQLFKGSAANGATWYFYYLFAPSTGTNNVVFSSGSSGDLGISVATYYGVSQSGFDSSNSGTYGATTSESISTTVVAANCWTIGFRGGNRTPTQTTGILRQQNSANNESALGDSNGTVGTGLQSLGWTSASEPTTNNQMYIVSIAPFITPDGPVGVKAYDGVTMH